MWRSAFDWDNPTAGHSPSCDGSEMQGSLGQLAELPIRTFLSSKATLSYRHPTFRRH